VRVGGRESGYTLLEALIGGALGMTLVVVAGLMWARTGLVAARARPDAVRVGEQAATFEDLRAMVRLAGARLAYFDMIKTVKGQLRATATSGPPPGWCLVVATDSRTWPPGFDPRNPSTWTSVAWWSEAVPSDPSTWYWDCVSSSSTHSSSSPAPIPHEFTLVPAFT
jgi:hypothetical protein